MSTEPTRVNGRLHKVTSRRRRFLPDGYDIRASVVSNRFRCPNPLAVLGLAVVLGVGTWPAQAQGEGRVTRTSDGVLAMLGTGGQDNVSVHVIGTTYVFESLYPDGPLSASDGCEQRARKVVACAGDGVVRVAFATGPAADWVELADIPASAASTVVPVPVAISTGSGDDYVYGGLHRGTDTETEPAVAPITVVAGAGNDELIGGTGADRLDGGPGIDRVFGGFGADTLLGGSGDDFLFDEDQTPGTLDCGPGADLLQPDRDVDALRRCEQPRSEWGLDAPDPWVEHRFKAYSNGTTFTRLRVHLAVQGAVVTVTCRGGGCPSRSQRSRLRKWRGQWNVLGRLAGRRLRPGTRLTVTIKTRGYLTKVVRLTIRRRRAPARKTRCVGPISGMVTRHCLSRDRELGAG